MGYLGSCLILPVLVVLGATNSVADEIRNPKVIEVHSHFELDRKGPLPFGERDQDATLWLCLLGGLLSECPDLQEEVCLAGGPVSPPAFSKTRMTTCAQEQKGVINHWRRQLDEPAEPEDPPGVD